MILRRFCYSLADFDAGLKVLEHHADGNELESSRIDELQEWQLNFDGVLVSVSLVFDVYQVGAVDDFLSFFNFVAAFVFGVNVMERSVSFSMPGWLSMSRYSRL